MTTGSKKTTLTKGNEAWAAPLAIGATSVFVVLLLLLHVLKPELDPSWRLISEYEIGTHGWLMQVAFFALAVGALSTLVAIRPYVKNVAGYVGLVLLGVGVLGLVLGGIYITDPITTSRDAFTTSGIWHNIGGSLMIFPAPITLLLLTLALRRNAKWQLAMKRLWGITALVWLSLATYVYIGVILNSGIAGSESTVGWPNRVFILSYCAWLIAAAWHVKKLT